MRCPDCNKFASMSLNDNPEQQSLDLGGNGRIVGEYRIVLVCDECGTELKEFNATIEGQVPEEFGSEHSGSGKVQCSKCRGTGLNTENTAYDSCGECGGAGTVDVEHELSIDATEETPVEESKEIPPKTKRGKVRFVTVYGVHVDATVACSCDPDAHVGVDLDSEKVEARDFEECQ